MAITLVSNNKLFENKKNMVIIFKDLSPFSTSSTIKENDFIFIFSNDVLVGINVMNYQKYFNEVEEGFHLISDEIKNYMLKNYSKYVDEKKFESFFKVGQVKKVSIHPNSDKLKLLNVLFDDKERQIVTNVQTIEENKKYLFAINGATTFSGLRIIDSKVMNVLSEGMIMSYKSLGINKDEIIDCDNLTITDEFVF